MNDPYKVLNCSRNATEEQIKSIYRKLARKYHPDRYQNSPLAKEADEKMKTINAAYSQIMKEKRMSAEPAYAESEYCIDVDGDYYEIEKMINSEKYDEAEKILSEVLSSDRKGEWYYCSALLSYHRGWLEEAYNYIETACNMDRNNEKYIRLYNTITESRSGTVFAKRGSSGRLCSADNCENCADLCECCCDIGDCFSGF